jgi:hypothetical protein
LLELFNQLDCSMFRLRGFAVWHIRSIWVIVLRFSGSKHLAPPWL